MRKPGFTLIEMLVATMLSVVLMGGILVVMSGLSRDARRLATTPARIDVSAVVDLLRWDLGNARTMSQSADGRTLVLVGHGAIERASLRPNGRLVRVTYSCQSRRNVLQLVRRQQYLDDPTRPQPWSELAAQGISGLEILPVGSEPVVPETQPAADEGPGPVVRVPAWVRLRVYGPSGAVERQLCVR